MFEFLKRIAAWFRKKPDGTIPVLMVKPEVGTAVGEFPSEVQSTQPIFRDEPFVSKDLVSDPPREPATVRPARGKDKSERLPAGYRDSIADIALDFLAQVKNKPWNSTWALKAVGGLRQAAYDNLTDCDFAFIDDRTDSALRDIDNQSQFVTGTPSEQIAALGGTVDYAAMLKIDDKDETEHQWQRMYRVWRIASIGYDQIRSLTTIVPKHPMLWSEGSIFRDGTREAHSFILGEVNKKWTIISNPDLLTHKITDSDKRNVPSGTRKLLALALARRYTWHAAMGDPNGARLLLPSSAEGCAKLFTDRDKPIDGRRAALKHWVEQHYRESATDEKDLHFVRQHLRGATKFAWRGMGAEIMVSQYDMDRNDFYKEQAEEWRAQRKHNSVKVRLKERRKSNFEV